MILPFYAEGEYVYLIPQETTAPKFATYNFDRFPENRFVPRVDL